MKKIFFIGIIFLLLNPSFAFALGEGGIIPGPGSGSMTYPAAGLCISTGNAWDTSINPSANVQTLLGSADYAAFRTSIGLVIGTNVQAYRSATDWKSDLGIVAYGPSTVGILHNNASNLPAVAPAEIDAHAASTTITLIPGVCPVIHNAGQAAADVNNTLPDPVAGYCFVAQVRTTQTNYWRLTTTTGAKIALDKTAGKNYMSFNSGQLAIDNYYTCIASGTDHYACYTGVGTAVTN